ncbi:MAG TPA: hypothetical protein VGD26_01980 [Chitinophagaceae bacterium]
MTTIKLIRLLQLFTYLIVVSQLAYYVFVMGDALKMVSIGNFVEQRKIVDPMVHQRHVPFYYAALILTLVMLIWHYKEWNSGIFMTTAFALLCLIADVYLGLKENGPINTLVNQTAMGTPGIDWEGLRLKWISLIKIRGMISMAGFVSLLTGLIWK